MGIDLITLFTVLGFISLGKKFRELKDMPSLQGRSPQSYFSKGWSVTEEKGVFVVSLLKVGICPEV